VSACAIEALLAKTTACAIPATATHGQARRPAGPAKTLFADAKHPKFNCLVLDICLPEMTRRSSGDGQYDHARGRALR
jgi:hypothetical protein